MINKGETRLRCGRRERRVLASDRWRARGAAPLLDPIDGVTRAAALMKSDRWRPSLDNTIFSSSGMSPMVQLACERSYICNRFLQRAAVAARARAIKFGLLC